MVYLRSIICWGLSLTEKKCGWDTSFLVIIKCDRISYVQCVRFNNQSTHQHSYVFYVLYLKIILLSSYTDSFISSIFLFFRSMLTRLISITWSMQDRGFNSTGRRSLKYWDRQRVPQNRSWCLMVIDNTVNNLLWQVWVSVDLSEVHRGYEL